METEISQRKAEHLEVAQLASSQSLSARLWDHIRFEPNALPELDLAAIDSSLEFLDRVISCPLLISSMSGGIENADRMNIHLAEAAAETNVALALGSMRISLEQGNANSSFNLRAEQEVEELISELPPEIRSLFGEDESERSHAVKVFLEEGIKEISARMLSGERETSS